MPARVGCLSFQAICRHGLQKLQELVAHDYACFMDILSPEDRVILWRSTVDAEGPQRGALLHAIAREVVDSLSSLNLYGSEYGNLVLESLAILDDAQVFASDE